MRILVLGSGAREHALAWKLSQDPNVTHVICAPGNSGIARSVATAPLDILDADAVIRFVDQQQIDLTVVGPEAPLGRGLVNRFEAEGRKVFGPTQGAAQLETSKAFAKDFMARHNVPTAHYRVCTSADEAIAAIRSGEFGDALVVKADGLAAGKGVVVASDRATAEAAVKSAMIDKSFGDAGSRIVLEELLTGPELSFFVVANGEPPTFRCCQRRTTNAYSMTTPVRTPAEWVRSRRVHLMNDVLQERIERTIVQPVLKGMAAEGNAFQGFLYCGLMLTAEGPKVIEFNVRFGDPEAQVVLPLLGQLAPLLTAASGPGNREPGAALSGSQFPAAGSRVAVGVVLAAHGYPGEVRTGDVIHGLDDVSRDCPDVQIFFAGVTQRGDDLVTAGGRVLTVMATAPSFAVAIARAYEAASKITFDGIQYRRDIGRKALLVP